MQQILVTILALFALFYALGKSADLAINNIKIIAEKLGIGIFFLGLVMGFFTSFPEMGIGINSIITNVQNISLGNLLGGSMVLFGLILGLNVYLQREIKSEQNVWQFGMIMVFLLIPVFLGMDGTLSMVEGLIIVLGYFILIFTIYYRQKHKLDFPYLSGERRGLIKNVFLFLLGVILILIIAHFTVDLTIELLSQLNLSKLVIGIVIFSIGTNFPEIIIALRARKNHLKKLPFSNLLGSGMANMLLVGIFSVMRPFHFNVDSSYYILIAGLVILFALVFIFYRSERMMERKEGIILILFYLLFVILQIVFENPIVPS